MPIIHSIIILSYNTKEVTKECLRRVKEAKDYYEKNKTGEVEVVVVDNNSTDGSPELIKAIYPWIKIIRNKENKGFAVANNQAMSIAKGKYFLLLNSDAYIKKDTLVDSETYLHKLNADILACKLTYKDGSFQPSGGFLPSPSRSLFWMFGLEKLPILDSIILPVHPSNPQFFRNDRKLEWIMGAFMFMKREVFEKTNGFDEKFFLYMEEVEWCKRIIDLGFSVFYTPSFSIIHLGRASSNFDMAKPLVMEAQGLIYFTNKHYPESISLVKAGIIIGSSLRYILFMILGNKQKAQAYRKIMKL